MLRRVLDAYRQAYAGLPGPVWRLAVATLVNRSGTMVLPFLALYLTREQGFTTIQAGQALAAYGLGGAAGSFLGGWLSDRLAPWRVMVGSLTLHGIGFLVLEHVQGHAAILFMVLGLSLVGEAFRPAMSSAIAAVTAPDERPRSFALYRLAINLGMTFGPTVGGFLAVHDYAWLFRADGVTCLLAAAFLLLSFRRGGMAARVVPEAQRVVGISPWQDRPFLAMLGLLFLLAAMTFQIASTFPLTLRDHYGMSEAWIGLVFGINTLVIVLFEMVLVHRLEQRDPLAIVGFGAFLFGLGFALLPLGSTFAFAAFTVLVWTVGEMLSFPIVSGVVANRAGEANMGLYMGLFNLSFEGAYVVAPLAGTWIYQRFGPLALGLGCGVLGLVLWVGFQALSKPMRRRPSLPGPLSQPPSLPPGEGEDRVNRSGEAEAAPRADAASGSPGSSR